MREHVFAVAKENGCFEQFYHARYDKPVIAVIIPEVISQYYTRYMHLLQNAIEENGYTMLLSISNFDRHLAEELTRYYTQHHRTDGLIMFGSERGFPKNSKTVGIQITGKEPQNVGASVSHVLDGALEQALRCLQAKGHTKIAYVGEAFTEGKKFLLQKKMQEFGMEIRPEWIYTSRMRFEDAGKDGVCKLLQGEERPTAVFGAYGYITQGILQELETMGLEVPRDISVISMDHDPKPLHPTMKVSYITSGIEETCAQVMEFLKERLGSNEPNEPCKQIQVELSFHEGETIRDLTK
jgi:DNA-binding LacI/PurR family transcriptional regulator